MRKINQIENVIYLGKFDNKVIFSSENVLYILDNNNYSNKYIHQNDKIQFVEIYNDERILLNENSIYNRNVLEFQFNKENQSVNTYFNGIILKDIDFEKEEIDFFKFNFDKESKIKLDINHKNTPIALYENTLVFKSSEGSSSYIEFYDFNIKEHLQKLSLNNLLGNDKAKIYGKPQIFENKLFVFLYDRSHQTNIKKTICLDINSASLLWESKSISGWLTTFKDKIYSVKGKELQVLDPETFKVTQINLQEQLSILDGSINDSEGNLISKVIFSFSSSVYTIHDNRLYFTQEKGNIIGTINLLSQKLEWYTNLEIDSGEFIPIVTKMEFNDNKLYVLDSGSTMHVFGNQEGI